MSTEIIDAAVDAATIPETPVETPQTEEVAEQPAQEAEAPVFDKKFENMKARLKNEKRELQFKLQQAQAELEKYKAPPKEVQPKSDAPQEEQFDSYGEYLKAVAKYEARQEFATQKQEDQKTEAAQREQFWIQEREDAIAEQARETIKTVPDFENVLDEHADLIDSLPPQIQRVFLEADNAPMAFYALAKEGKLEALSTMSPARAAIEIGKAEDRGVAMTKKPVTNAPTPISSSKGTGAGAKSLDAMSPDDLRAWLKS